MLTVDAQVIIENAAGFCGLDRDNLDAGEFADFRAYLNNRLRQGWRWRAWSDLELTEERWFRAFYASGTAYAAPTTTTAVEVFDPATQLYYQTLRSTTGNAPSVAGVENSAYWAECADEYSADDWATAIDYEAGDQVFDSTTNRYYQCHTAHTSSGSLDGTKFGILTPFDRYVAFEQSGQTAIGDVLAVQATNWKVDISARNVDHKLSENGIQIAEDLASVWIHFRQRPPYIRGIAYDATKVYTANVSQIYYQTASTVGNFYNCLTTTTAGDTPVSAAAKWDLVEIPRFLQTWLEEGIAADWLADDDRAGAASRHETLARESIAAEALHHDDQSTETLTVKTR